MRDAAPALPAPRRKCWRRRRGGADASGSGSAAAAGEGGPRLSVRCRGGAERHGEGPRQVQAPRSPARPRRWGRPRRYGYGAGRGGGEPGDGGRLRRPRPHPPGGTGMGAVGGAPGRGGAAAGVPQPRSPVGACTACPSPTVRARSPAPPITGLPPRIVSPSVASPLCCTSPTGRPDPRYASPCHPLPETSSSVTPLPHNVPQGPPRASPLQNVPFYPFPPKYPPPGVPMSPHLQVPQKRLHVSSHTPETPPRCHFSPSLTPLSSSPFFVTRHPETLPHCHPHTCVASSPPYVPPHPISSP